MPNLELYDGTKDPREHLGVYKAQMYIRDVDDLAYCMYFSATLKGCTKVIQWPTSWDLYMLPRVVQPLCESVHR